MLEKINEIYESGALVAEIFKNSQFIVQLSSDNICLQNDHYLGSSKVENYIVLRGDERDKVSKVISLWEKKKDGLWGRISHGGAMIGHTSTTYYPPNSKEGNCVKKNSKGKIVEPDEVGTLEEKIVVDDFECVIERFTLALSRGNNRALFDRYQFDLIVEAFDTWDIRKGNYAQKSFEDLGFKYSRYYGVSL